MRTDTKMLIGGGAFLSCRVSAVLNRTETDWAHRMYLSAPKNLKAGTVESIMLIGGGVFALPCISDSWPGGNKRGIVPIAHQKKTNVFIDVD